MAENITNMLTGVTSVSVYSDATTATSHFKPNSSVFNIVQGILYGSLLLFGFLFNLCVILLIHRHRSLHTVINMWVTSLCTSQLLICILSLPFAVVSVFADRWLFGVHFCRIYGFYTTVFRTTSILSVAGIALARHHIVTRPFNPRIEKASVRMHIALTWWIAIVAAVPPLFGIGLYRYSASSHSCVLSLPLGGSSLAYVVLYFVGVYVSSLLASSVAYKQIYQVTKAQANKRKRPSVAGGLASGLELSRTATSKGNVSDTNTTRTKEVAPARRRLTAVINGKMMSRVQGSLRHRFSITSAHSNIDHRAASTIILVMTLFVFTWIPYYIFGIYASLRLADSKLSGALSWLEFFSLWLSLSNVIWDPILYGILNQTFRSRLKDTLSASRLVCLCQKTTPNFRPYDGQLDNNNIVVEVPTTNLEKIGGSDASKLEENTMTDETYRDYEIARESCHAPLQRYQGFYVGDTPVVQSEVVVPSSASNKHRRISSRDASSLGNSRLFFIPSKNMDQKVHNETTKTNSSIDTLQRGKKPDNFVAQISSSELNLSHRSCKHSRSKSVQYPKTFENINHPDFSHTLYTRKSNFPESSASVNASEINEIQKKRKRRYTTDHSCVTEALPTGAEIPSRGFESLQHAYSKTRLRRGVTRTLVDGSKRDGLDHYYASQSLDRHYGKNKTEKGLKGKDITTKHTFAVDV